MVSFQASGNWWKTFVWAPHEILDNLTSLCVAQWVKTSYTIGEFKAHLPEALDAVQKGDTISITYGRARRPVAELVPPARVQKRRKLGALCGKVKVSLSADWKMDEEAFLNS